MPAGLQIWNAAGLLVHDITTRMPRKFGQIDIGADGSATTGSVYDARYQLVIDGKATFFCLALPLQNSGTFLFDQPTVTLSGYNVTWTWPTATRIPFRIIYGVY